MRPENVNPANFQVDNILYDNGNFAIAYGTWEDGDKYVAMRWNGEENESGYPKVFNHPMWFIVDRPLSLSILQSILGQPTANNESILSALNEVVRQ